MSGRFTHTCVAGMVGLLVASGVEGQGVEVRIEGPLNITPGDTLVLSVVAQAEPSSLIHAIGGFAFDVLVMEGSGELSNLAAPVVGAFDRGYRLDGVGVTGIEGIVGGQYPDISGSNPSINIQNPVVLFTFEITADADAEAGQAITITPGNPAIAGGIFVYPAIGSTTVLSVPSTAGSSLEFTPLTLMVAESCVADVNGDGVVTPTDVSAWINAYNNAAPGCDQNGDGACGPSDFTAWIANYNTGC